MVRDKCLSCDICVQETQWEAPVEGFLPAPKDWLLGQQAAWLAGQDATECESAEDMFTKDSSASSTADQPSVRTKKARDSLSRLALDDADADSNPNALAIALADAPAQSPPDSTFPEAKLVSASNVADMPAGAQSAAAPQSCIQGALAPAPASASASAVVDEMFEAAMPAARVESTGVMASIPEPQGRHIRYDSTDAESDSGGVPANSATLQEGTAQPLQSTDCELNSIDQEEVFDAVADLHALACTAASNVNDSVVNGCCDVSNAMMKDAMQGVLATTVVTPAASERATQASSISADLADAPPEGETSALAHPSTLHADSSADSKLREAGTEANHAQGLADGVLAATAPDPLAGTSSVDLTGGSQPELDCCIPLEAGPPFFRTFRELDLIPA